MRKHSVQRTALKLPFTSYHASVRACPCWHQGVPSPKAVSHSLLARNVSDKAPQAYRTPQQEYPQHLSQNWAQRTTVLQHVRCAGGACVWDILPSTPCTHNYRVQQSATRRGTTQANPLLAEGPLPIPSFTGHAWHAEQPWPRASVPQGTWLRAQPSASRDTSPAWTTRELANAHTSPLCCLPQQQPHPHPLLPEPQLRHSTCSLLFHRGPCRPCASRTAPLQQLSLFLLRNHLNNF